MTQAGHVIAGGRRGACHPVAGGCSGHRELQLLAPGPPQGPQPSPAGWLWLQGPPRATTADKGILSHSPHGKPRTGTQKYPAGRLRCSHKSCPTIQALRAESCHK